VGGRKHRRHRLNVEIGGGVRYSYSVDIGGIDYVSTNRRSEFFSNKKVVPKKLKTRFSG
jgi:hypothetical protein